LIKNRRVFEEFYILYEILEKVKRVQWHDRQFMINNR
jgi:hypothetical protein